jgi:hypothetical protein
MQNKPNFLESQMNVNAVITKDYEKRTLGERGKNKPNSKPIKANKMPKQTQYKPNQTQFAGCSNERNFAESSTILRLGCKYGSRIRAYPNNRVVMRPSEKFEAKAAGQKCSEAWFSPR